ncbi:MAG: ABC transporter permease [Candidatus Bathyarchaeia archaeon]
MIESIIALLKATIEFSTPILLAALGEIFAERSGVMNLGIEGIMLLGAFCSFWATYSTGIPELGIIVSLIVGSFMGLIMAILSVSIRANQVVSGLAIWILGIGLSTYLSRKVLGIVPGGVSIKGLSPINIPLLHEIPLIGQIFFEHNLLVYLTLILVPICGIVLFNTTIGLKIRAVGERPRVADTLGINVFFIRYLCVIFGGALAGLSGAYLTIGRLFTWIEEITAGRGWLAIVVVLFGRRDPYKALIGAWIFGAIYALQYRLQTTVTSIPYQFLLMLPYLTTIITILVVITILGKEEAPGALGIPYSREEPD